MSQGRTIAKVTVDRSLCFSHEQCSLVAPEVFSLDDDAISTVGDITLVDDETLLQAAQACPAAAISVYDADGNQLYPKPPDW